jgi:hypothetical protein
VFTVAKEIEMSKQAYLKARSLIRANGYFALRWIRMSEASIMLQLKNQKADPLEEKAATIAYIAKYEQAYC